MANVGVNGKKEMNENLKTYVWKENRENQNNKADYKKKTRKLWKWIVIGGNFFIISRIINWVPSQFLNINFKSGSRTPVLSKVEFIVTGTAITFSSVGVPSISDKHCAFTKKFWKIFEK